MDSAAGMQQMTVGASPGVLRQILAVPGRAYRLLLIPLIYLRMGKSPADAWRAVRLRLTSTGPGRKLTRQKLQPLHLRALERPIQLRQATSDFFVVRQIYEEGEYEPAKQWRLPPGSTLVDLGGNVGLATLYLDSVFPGIKVLSVEPDESNRRLLEANCRHLIDAGRMTVVGAFVAAQDGAAGIDRGDDNWGFKKIGAPAGGEVIACYSVPTLLARSGIDGVDLLKCDVEGTEAELFKNCSRWIGRVKHLVVETHAPYKLSDLYAELRAAGWDFEVTAEREDPFTGLCFLKRVSQPVS
jgi:FkbM family methyltransferase